MIAGAQVAPKLVRLASPTALVNLEAFAESRILVSERDARCYFDQLKLPEVLRPWLGRPSLSLDLLCKHGGFSRSDLKAFMLAGESLPTSGPV